MPVWDEYLSDRDRAHLAATPAPPPVVLGARPALVLVDFWSSSVGPEGVALLDALATAPHSMGVEAHAAIARTRLVLERFRGLGLPVFHTTMGAGEHVAAEWYSATRELEPPGNRSDAAFQLVEQLRPVPGEVVLCKTAASAFWGTDLAGALQSGRVDTLVVCGASTSGCVRATVVDAASYRYRVAVLEDCVYDRHQAPHAINLFDMQQKYALVLPARQLLDRLGDDGALRRDW